MTLCRQIWTLSVAASWKALPKEAARIGALPLQTAGYRSLPVHSTRGATLLSQASGSRALPDQATRNGLAVSPGGAGKKAAPKKKTGKKSLPKRAPLRKMTGLRVCSPPCLPPTSLPLFTRVRACTRKQASTLRKQHGPHGAKSSI